MPATRQKIIQLGQEVTWGTPVAATVKLMGVTDVSIDLSPEIVQTSELGSMGPSPLTAMTKRHVEGTIQQDMTYNDCLYPLHGLFGTGVVTTVTAGVNKRVYTAPYGSVAPGNPFTAQVGAPNASYICEGAMFSKVSIGWRSGEVWKMTSNFLAQDAAPGALTTLADRAVRLINGATLWINTSTGTIGGTSVPGTFIGFEVSIDSKRHLKHFGELVADAWGDGEWEVTVKTTFEWNATTKAYIDELLSSTGATVQRLMRIGRDDDTRHFYIDLAVYLSGKPKLFSDRDGNITVELEWKTYYNTTLGSYLIIEAQNGVAQTLP